MAEKRFKYKSGWTEGVSVPDGFININGYDPNNDARNYKLLEALNVDWKDIELPWARSISKWNSWNIDPNNLSAQGPDYDNAVDDALASPDVVERLSNRVDWFNQNYDYLKDNGYIDENGKLEIPGWSKNGKIEKSEDIIDAINYLIWRVITLDYFTNNWNNRNAEKVNSSFVPFVPQEISDIAAGNSSDYSNFSDYIITKSQGTFNFTFTPSVDRNNVQLLTNDGKDIAFISTSSGELSLLGEINPNIITITVGDETHNYNSRYVDKTNTEYYFFMFNAFVKGTAIRFIGPYTVSSTTGYVDAYKENSLDAFDPIKFELNFNLKQKSGTIHNPNGTMVTFEEYVTDTIKIIINKVKNELQSLAFNNTTYNLNVSENENYGRTYTTTGKVSVPYFKNIEGVTNEYPISFTLKYGKEYGIYPYFFIKKGNENVPGENHYTTSGITTLFDYYECDYGSIKYDNEDNKYYYIPPQEPTTNSSDTDLTICCVFYYGDTTLSRQVTPTFASFNIMLTATVQNRIIFLEPGTTEIRKWSRSQKEFGPIRLTNNSIWVDRSGIVATPENNVPYAVRTVTYDEYSRLGGTQLTVTGKEGQKNVTENSVLLFDTFVTTYCDSPFDVQFVGAVHQSSYSDREISLNPDDLDSIASSYVRNSFTGTTNPYPIRSSLAFGNPIYYSADKATDYTLDSSVINGLNNIHEINDNLSVLDNIDNDEYIEQLSRSLTGQEDTHTYDILKSTAMYPAEDGIIEKNNKLCDADNDYYFLVFKISSEEGTNDGGIAYSACKGYYFLRVLRKNSSPGFTMAGNLDNEIEYSMGGTTYTMRSQVKQTIYLNRILTTRSQQDLAEFTGKKYWSLYGYGETENTSAAWDETKIAVKNVDTNEQYIFVYNEGDTCNVKTYNVADGKKNNYNTITNPEGNMIVTLDGGTQHQIEKFSDTSSGAILFVNKFMRAITDVSGTPYEYQPVEGDSVSMTLALSLGNTERFIRMSTPTLFPLTVHKRQYDIELLEIGSPKKIASYPATNPMNVKIRGVGGNDGWLVGNGGTEGLLSLQSLVDAPINRKYLGILFLGSNELGTGTNPDLTENTDVIPITLDNSRPTINVTNGEGYSFKANVVLNINGNPRNLFNTNDTATGMYLSNTHTDNDHIEVRYHQFFNDTGVGADWYSIILTFGFIENAQSHDRVELTICTDNCGVYAEKTLKYCVLTSTN